MANNKTQIEIELIPHVSDDMLQYCIAVLNIWQKQDVFRTIERKSDGFNTWYEVVRK